MDCIHKGRSLKNLEHTPEIIELTNRQLVNKPAISA